MTEFRRYPELSTDEVEQRMNTADANVQRLGLSNKPAVYAPKIEREKMRYELLCRALPDMTTEEILEEKRGIASTADWMTCIVMVDVSWAIYRACDAELKRRQVMR